MNWTRIIRLEIKALNQLQTMKVAYNLIMILPSLKTPSLLRAEFTTDFSQTAQDTDT